MDETEWAGYRRLLEGAQWKVAKGREYQTADVTDQMPGVKRAFFLKLPPRSKIHGHIDAGDCRTEHIVMQTNWLCFNHWDDGEGEQVMHMDQGYRYAVDRTVWHSASNGGDTDRVHLLIEY